MPNSTAKVEDPCQECRDRHLKCDDSRPKCKQCERLGEKCIRGKGKLKFRHGSSARYDATFAKDQTWLEQSRNAKIQFVDQGPELENYYAQDDDDDVGTEVQSMVSRNSREGTIASTRAIENTSQLDNSPLSQFKSPAAKLPTPINPVAVTPTAPTPESGIAHSPTKRRRTDEGFTQPFSGGTREWSNAVLGDTMRSSYRIYESKTSPSTWDGITFVTETSNVPKMVEAEYRRLADTEAAAIPPEFLLSPAIWREEFYWPNQFTTTQCACLMRYYIEHVAPWFDVGDPNRHFTLLVPQRARRCPPLLNAIFTAAARQLASLDKYRTSDGVIRYHDVLLPQLGTRTALKYHNACIAYLIKLSDDAEHVQDENLIAAAVILRYYEELDTSITGKDQETFLNTLQIFLNTHARTNIPSMLEHSSPDFLGLSSTNSLSPIISDYLSSFQHASFRIALRQEITMAFMKQRSIRLSLDSWSILEGFEKVEDFIWADRHLYHCAKVLQFCFGGESLTGRSQFDRWTELKNFEVLWEQHKPLSFSPIHMQEPDRTRGEVFPQIWYMADIHVSGLQYLDLARILLTVYNPNVPRLGPRAAAAQRHIAEEVKGIVSRLCGIATSSSASHPALVEAYKAIAICGEYFTEPDDQNALLSILSKLEIEHGWPTAKTAADLKQGWGWEY